MSNDEVLRRIRRLEERLGQLENDVRGLVSEEEERYNELIRGLRMIRDDIRKLPAGP